MHQLPVLTNAIYSPKRFKIFTGRLIEMKHLKDFDFIEGIVRSGSIRKAAEDMFITASALNRRINRFEEEMGCEIFERLPRGVRLNTAGELLLHHIRVQKSDLARLKSQIADLSGMRRGHVSIACSQALIPFFLPKEISHYRLDHPGVTFSINVRDRDAAEKDLAEFQSDIALVFEPLSLVDFDVLCSISQPIHVLMRRNHPLSKEKVIRLRDALSYPHIAPSEKLAVRALLDDAAKRLNNLRVNPLIESESFDLMRRYAEWEDVLAFQFPIGLDIRQTPDLIARPLATRDVSSGNLFLGQLKGRTLPIASAKFMRKLVKVLQNVSE